MSIESERQRLWKIFNDDNCYPDEMMEAVDLDRIALEARAEMPCYAYDPRKPNDGLPFGKNCECPACIAKRTLRETVTI